MVWVVSLASMNVITHTLTAKYKLMVFGVYLYSVLLDEAII